MSSAPSAAQRENCLQSWPNQRLWDSENKKTNFLRENSVPEKLPRPCSYNQRRKQFC